MGRTGNRARTLAFWQALGFVLVLDEVVAPYGFGLMFLAAPNSQFQLDGFNQSAVRYVPGAGSNGGGAKDGDTGFVSNADTVPISLQQQKFAQLQIQYFLEPTEVQRFAWPSSGEAGWLGFVLEVPNPEAFLSYVSAIKAEYVTNGDLHEPNGVPLKLERT